MMLLNSTRLTLVSSIAALLLLATSCGYHTSAHGVRLPPDMHTYAILPIGYPIGRFGPVRRVPLQDVVYEDRWGQPYQDK